MSRAVLEVAFHVFFAGFLLGRDSASFSTTSPAMAGRSSSLSTSSHSGTTFRCKISSRDGSPSRMVAQLLELDLYAGALGASITGMSSLSDSERVFFHETSSSSWMAKLPFLTVVLVDDDFFFFNFFRLCSSSDAGLDMYFLR